MPHRQWGGRLASVMRQRKISQRSLAEAMEVSAQAVSKWIAGGDIEFDKLRRLSELLDVNWVWLRYGEEALEAARRECGTGDRVAIMRYEVLREAVKNEQRARAALGLLNIGVWELNFKTGESFWSPVTRILLGVDPICPATQMNFRKLVVPEDVIVIDESIRRAMREGGFIEQRMRLLSRPKSPLRAYGRVIKDEEGKSDRIVGIVAESRLFECCVNRRLSSANSCTKSNCRH